MDAFTTEEYRKQLYLHFNIRMKRIFLTKKLKIGCRKFCEFFVQKGEFQKRRKIPFTVIKNLDIVKTERFITFYERRGFLCILRDKQNRLVFKCLFSEKGGKK